MKNLDEKNFDDSDSEFEDEFENSILENEIELDVSANFDEEADGLFSWKEVEGSEMINVLPFSSKVDAISFKTENDFFKLMLTDEILAVLVEETNRYAFDLVNLHGESSDKRKHASSWKPTDATGYTYDMRVYLGKDKKENLSTSASYNVVYTMTDCIKGKGHKVFMDNFFSSPELFRDLLKERSIIYNSCGTVRSNRKHFPKDLAPCKMRQGDVAVKFCNGMTALCWEDKRQVYMLTNMHSPRNKLITEELKRFFKKFDGDVSLCKKEKLTTTKPKIVADYNKNMGYVDLGDRMASTYSFARRTRKWTKKLFFSLIDIAVLNAFLMFKSCRTSSKFSLKEFRMNLITSLIGKINHKNAEHSVTKKAGTNDNTFSHWPFDEKKRSRSFEPHEVDSMIWLVSTLILRKSPLGGGQRPPSNLTGGPSCRKDTIHLQTSMPFPGIEASPYGTAVSVANYYTGWAIQYIFKLHSHLGCHSSLVVMLKSSWPSFMKLQARVLGPMKDPQASFTSRQSASSIERLANQRLHLARDEVSDSLDADCLVATSCEN
ncbi:piggyBac transposable element-derived protein 4 [Trichonephila clavipes]|nr:piggyBac transposable element-derived protein 4 [Trichonephila clavipes]